MSIYKHISKNCSEQKKQLALLIDPDKYDSSSLRKIINMAHFYRVDYIFVGGSLVANNIDDSIHIIKSITDIPVLLFPGNVTQISFKADAILFLALHSGRNPEYLIGQHVAAAPIIKKYNIEAISTSYLLIEGGSSSSVEYISNTKPIPCNKADLAVATATAGELLGSKMIFMDAGSGAENPPPVNFIHEVKKHIDLPLIVGGGIKNLSQLQSAFNAGADIAVIGNIIEKRPELLEDFALTRTKINL